MKWSESHLHPRLAEVEPHGELLAREHVGVLRLVEGALELVQLVRGEGGPAAAHLLVQATPRLLYFTVSHYECT